MPSHSPDPVIVTLCVSRNRVDHPTWNDIEEALRCMHGVENYSVILITPNSEEMMMIGGGEKGQYVCIGELLRGQFVLSELSRPREQLISIYDGQPSAYIATHVVSLEQVVEAAHYFATTGELTPSLSWERS
jgi:hypothetical protein